MSDRSNAWYWLRRRVVVAVVVPRGVSLWCWLGGGAVMAKFKVTIWFRDGKYENNATASDSVEAYTLALFDARLASPFGTFYGDVVAWDSVEVVE